MRIPINNQPVDWKKNSWYVQLVHPGILWNINILNLKITPFKRTNHLNQTSNAAHLTAHPMGIYVTVERLTGGFRQRDIHLLPGAFLDAVKGGVLGDLRLQCAWICSSSPLSRVVGKQCQGQDERTCPCLASKSWTQN